MTISTHLVAPNVLHSPWPDPDVPDVALPEFLLAAAAERADHPAVVDAASGHTLTYAQLADGVRRVAAGLAARGLRPREAFAILAPNSPEWLVACYGAMTAGGVVTGINPLYTPDEVAAQLADADARFLLAAPAFLPTARAAVARAGGRARIVVLGPTPDDGTADTIAFTDLLVHGDRPPSVPIDPAADLALLPYSSGTTGLAKGVMLTHRACVTNVVQMLAAMPVDPTDRVLAVAPFFHAVGFSVLANRTLRRGATLVTLPRFDVGGFLGALQEHRITQIVVVPPVVLALAKHPAVDEHDLSALQWVGCGAAPLGAELQQACADRLGRPVGQGYGMTEATAAITLLDGGHPGRPRVRRGRLLPGLRARIVDPESGRRPPARRDGRAAGSQPGADDRLPGQPGRDRRDRRRRGLAAHRRHRPFRRRRQPLRRRPGQGADQGQGLPGRPGRAGGGPAQPPGGGRRRGRPGRRRVGGRGAQGVRGRRAGGDGGRADRLRRRRVAPHKRVREVAFIDAIPTSPSGKTLRRLLV